MLCGKAQGSPYFFLECGLNIFGFCMVSDVFETEHIKCVVFGSNSVLLVDSTLERVLLTLVNGKLLKWKIEYAKTDRIESQLFCLISFSVNTTSTHNCADTLE